MFFFSFFFSLQVVECLIKLIGPDGRRIHDNGSIFLACDTVVNLLLKVMQSLGHLI